MGIRIFPLLSELKKRRKEGRDGVFLSLPKSLIEDYKNLANEIGIPFSNAVGIAMEYFLQRVREEGIEG